MSREPIRFDEAGMAVKFAGSTFGNAIASYDPGNHVLYSILVWGLLQLFDLSIELIRLPALLAGVGVVGTGFLAARALWGSTAGLIAAGFLGGSSVLVEYSVNGRGYTIGWASMLLLIAVIGGDELRIGNRFFWVFVFSASAALFASPVMVLPLAGVVLFAGLRIPEQGEPFSGMPVAFAAVMSVSVAGLLYSPAMIVSGISSLVSNEVVTNQVGGPGAAYGVASVALEGLWRLSVRDLPRGIWLPALLAMGYGMYLETSRRRVPLLLCMVLPVAGYGLWRGLPYDRILLYLLPIAVVTAAGGIGAIMKSASRTGLMPTIGVAVLVLAVTVSGTWLSGSIESSTETGVYWPAKEVATWIEEELRPGDRVVTGGPARMPLRFYLATLRDDAGDLFLARGVRTRLLVVVDETRRETAGALLEFNDIEQGQWMESGRTRLGSTVVVAMRLR